MLVNSIGQNLHGSGSKITDAAIKINFDWLFMSNVHPSIMTQPLYLSSDIVNLFDTEASANSLIAKGLNINFSSLRNLPKIWNMLTQKYSGFVAAQGKAYMTLKAVSLSSNSQSVYPPLNTWDDAFIAKFAICLNNKDFNNPDVWNSNCQI